MRPESGMDKVRVHHKAAQRFIQQEGFADTYVFDMRMAGKHVRVSFGFNVNETTFLIVPDLKNNLLFG